MRLGLSHTHVFSVEEPLLPPEVIEANSSILEEGDNGYVGYHCTSPSLPLQVTPLLLPRQE